jgi:hypothetical protein
MGFGSALGLIAACAFASMENKRTLERPLPLYDVVRFYSRQRSNGACIAVGVACLVDGAPTLVAAVLVSLVFGILHESRATSRPPWSVLGYYLAIVLLMPTYSSLMFCGAGVIAAIPIIGVNVVSIVEPPPQWAGDTEELTKWWYDLRDGTASKSHLSIGLRLAHYIEWTGVALMLAVGI